MEQNITDLSSDKPLDKIWIRLNFDLESAVFIVLAMFEIYVTQTQSKLNWNWKWDQ